jgi:hypothetical protein
MRVLLVAVLILSAASDALALPFTGDPRCPIVNALVAQLQPQEANSPERAPELYMQVAQEYQKCMQAYAREGNTWQAFWAGTHAMEWANGAVNIGANGNNANPGASIQSVTRPAYTLIHGVYLYLVQLGIDFAQYGPEWPVIDGIARQKLGIK